MAPLGPILSSMGGLDDHLQCLRSLSLSVPQASGRPDGPKPISTLSEEGEDWNAS